MNSDSTIQESGSGQETDPIRPHVFDGDIREYDKRLPNWWLTVFWGAIVYAFGYWVWVQEWKLVPDSGTALRQTMAENARTASLHSGVFDNDALWVLSEDASVTKAGAATFATTCASCHMPDLKGGIGPNLRDQQWIHGGEPLNIVSTITSGVLAKGMPTWGPILGPQKIREVAAYILSFHHKGEPVEIVPGWTPILPGAPALTQQPPPSTP